MERWKLKEPLSQANIKLGLYHVLPTTTKTQKFPLTVVELQQLPEIEKTDPKDGTSCLNRHFELLG